MFYRRLLVVPFALVGCSKAASVSEVSEPAEVTAQPLSEDVSATDAPDAVSPAVAPSADATVS